MTTDSTQPAQPNDRAEELHREAIAIIRKRAKLEAKLRETESRIAAINAELAKLR